MLWPQYPLADLSPEHPVYSLNYKLKTRPRLQGVSNGSRLLMVHSPIDLAGGWQQRGGTSAGTRGRAVRALLVARRATAVLPRSRQSRQQERRLGST